MYECEVDNVCVRTYTYVLCELTVSVRCISTSSLGALSGDGLGDGLCDGIVG